LLWSLYKEVNNRVLFGDYESDWFSQDYVQLSPNFHTLSLSIRLPTTITFDLVSLNFKFHLPANFDGMSNSVWSSCSELAINVISSAKSSELINWFVTISYGEMVSKVNAGACYGLFIRKSTTMSFSVITNRTGLVRIMV
jgi:hypothetical protein